MKTSHRIRDFPDLNNFYFWLGEDGELESMLEEDFKRKQREYIERERRWKDVDVLSGEGYVD